MSRSLALLVAAGALCVGPAPAGDDKPVPKERELKTYTVSCKLTRKLLFNDGDGKVKVDTVTSKIPDVTTLEGTRGAYHSGGKLNATPYGFQLRFEVRPATGNKVRFEVAVESSDAEGGPNAVVRSHRQEVVRHVRLGQTITLELDRNDRGEGTWVELTVREAAE